MMDSSLFGKLPQKRDFISINTPRSFLNLWEEWLEDALYENQSRLKEAWQSTYKAMPTWRFWLGQQYCGNEVIGVITPSKDGAGRCYPLTLINFQDRAQQPIQHSLYPRRSDMYSQWFESAEELLKNSQNAAYPFEQIKQNLEAMTSIQISKQQALQAQQPAPNGSLWWQQSCSFSWDGALNSTLFDQLMTKTSI